jgi:nitroreductase
MKRKSCRSFEPKPVENDIKETLYEAAIQAPSAGNQQLYSIIDITDDTLKEQLSILCDNQPFIRNAPIVSIFAADCERWLVLYKSAGIEPRPPEIGDLTLSVLDACIAAHNFVTAAEAYGLRTCYIGDILENAESIRQLLGLPQTLVPAVMLVSGYPTLYAENRSKPRRFRLQDMVYENGYRQWSEQEAADAYMLREHITDADEYIRRMNAFYQRKYDSGFMLEMNRSVAEYVRRFIPENISKGEASN